MQVLLYLHILLTRRQGLLVYYMDGRLKCYFLKDSITTDLLEIMKKDYIEELSAPACCPVTKKGAYPGARQR
jgi:ArsR family transcriptional regulator